MHFTIYTIIFLISFFGMEFMAWFTHKYIMHGFMWNLHSDHHTGSEGKIEKNDWFSLIFAIPSSLLIWIGLAYENYFIASIGFGMTAYGIAYFFVHDIFIHQRIKVFRNLDTNYFRAIRRAHKMHHKHLSKENGESFGFLMVSLKYYKQDKNSKLNN